MLFKGTDREAYKKASVGKPPEQKSKIYYEEKAKNESRDDKDEQPKMTFFSLLKNPNNKLLKTPVPIVKLEPVKPLVGNKSLPPKVKYVPKQRILDDIREYSSSKIISDISNGLATIIMKTTRSRQMTNESK